MGGLLQLPSTAWSSRRANPLRAAHGKIHRQSVDEVLRPYMFLLVGAPRFELGTPCTPCKCATRLRHAPTRFLLLGTAATGDTPRLLRIIRCFAGPPSAAQHFHQLFEFGPHLLDDLLALRDISTRFFARELVARPADGEPLVVQQAPDLAD